MYYRLGVPLAVFALACGQGSQAGIGSTGAANKQEGLVCSEGGQGGAMECLDQATGEPMECKQVLDLNGAETLACTAVEPWEPWVPPCPDYRYPGDGVSGKQCWDPPSHYCSHGCNTGVGWYCKADGSRCCLSPCGDCFLCGWIDMQRCVPAGAAVPPDESLCQEVAGKLAPGYLHCMNEPGGVQAPECAFLLEDPECQVVDPQAVFCPVEP